MVNSAQSRAPSRPVDTSVPSQLEHTSQPQFWLDAYQDPVAGLRALASNVHTCDLSGDGDWRLVVAGLDKKLKAGFELNTITVVSCSRDKAPLCDAGVERHTVGFRATLAGHSKCNSQLLL